MSIEPEVGKVYNVSHSRKGKFCLKVNDVTNTWVGGVIVDGEAEAILQDNFKGEGEHINIRKSFCNFYPLKSQEEGEFGYVAKRE